ncbi:MAG: glycosyltransferase family 2 protein [Acetivibrio ethanolgignens]
MITISLCMIVKNEENLLKRCLDSIHDLMDEIIIVDTGSTDRTKEIAGQYTDKIYDFTWVYDFSAARNFSFSKATMEYIYAADADEVLDEENRKKFRQLKEAMLPEIELVQMLYCNQLQYNTTYNYDEEYRPKLYKRLREFVWEEPVHESVRLTPVIYDSDIRILHMPENNHAGRDFDTFLRMWSRGQRMSKKLHNMYARELFIAGENEDFLAAGPVFLETLKASDRGLSEVKEAACVVARAARLRGDIAEFFKNALKDTASEGCAEICCELGQFYYDRKEYQEALIWYYNAAFETKSILNIHSSGDLPLKRLEELSTLLGQTEDAKHYHELCEAWEAE